MRREHLEAFLEETALVNDTDDWETQLDRVTLMTLHASKGLEFPCVYLVAVEEGLLPHERSRGVAEQLEEERRLMFVGITRARQRLQISRAEYRDFRGERKAGDPQFVSDGTAARRNGRRAARETTRVLEIDDMPVDHEPVYFHDEAHCCVRASRLPTVRTFTGWTSESVRENWTDPDVHPTRLPIKLPRRLLPVPHCRAPARQGFACAPPRRCLTTGTIAPAPIPTPSAKG